MEWLTNVTQNPNATFAGANSAREIETCEEFLLKIQALLCQEQISLADWTFTQVDFQQEQLNGELELVANVILSAEFWQERLCFNKASFWGCRFPAFTSSAQIRRRGATVIDQPTNVPFLPFRAFMYSQEELQARDQAIYEVYCQKGDPQTAMLQAIHDYFMEDALLDYLEGKTVIGIMGGHASCRDSPEYALVVKLGWQLARQGFIVATGGGPGAMEAANLGAYLAENSELEVEEAIRIIASTPSKTPVEHEYLNTTASDAVLDRFGTSTSKNPGSLGVPTWRYGHEPSNAFARWHAKMFSNALREDGLIAIANGGIIYTPGSVGTYQEVFQAVCRNHYSPADRETPMVFLGGDFWKESGLIDCVQKVSSGKKFLNWLTVLDSNDSVLDHLIRYRTQFNLPVVTTDDLNQKFWERNEPDVQGDRRLQHCHTKRKNDRVKRRQSLLHLLEEK